MREKYGIEENAYVLVEVKDKKLVIIRAPSIEETLDFMDHAVTIKRH